MEILDKKSNRMSRANSGVFECNEFPDLQRILDFLSLRNLLSNELFFTFFIKCVRTLVALALVRVLAVRHVLVGYE